MPGGSRVSSAASIRSIPERMADRLIVALDVPATTEAFRIVETLDGLVSFFKIGLWLAFAKGVDGLIDRLVLAEKKVFLDAKMFDIGQTVQEGVARAEDRGVSFVTVHGDKEIISAAVHGKKTPDKIKIFSITVLTSLGDKELHEMGYRLTANELVQLRVQEAVAAGCDGVIASAHDNPDEIRRLAGAERLLIATPGIRLPGEPAHEHRRLATPGEAISKGADYLVVGRPIIAASDPRAAAQQVIAEMEQGELGRKFGAEARCRLRS